MEREKVAVPAEVARLADLREFDALREHFAARREEDVAKLGRQMFASPENYDRLDAERLKAFYRGVEEVLSLPLKARETIKRQEDRQ